MSALQKFKQEATELRTLLDGERETTKGLTEQLQKTSRQNAWLIVLLAAEPNDERQALIAQLRKEDPALADTLINPESPAAFRAMLGL